MGEGAIGPDTGPRAHLWQEIEPSPGVMPRAKAPSPSALVTFEKSMPGHPSVKAKVVREVFGLSLAVYFAYLHRAIRTAEGLKTDARTCFRVMGEIEANRRRRRVGHLREVGG